ncbi:MAG TPA: SDR family oxidoreductase [Candidatus Saccharimonadales bacterium]|nr:SDR family oxidoreductase [Candidatus Saccharimonadales bacterium]
MAIYEDLRGKVVLVTGGANGIGAATVRALHAQGSQTYFCDIDAPMGNRFAAVLGGGAFFSKVDLTKEKSVRSWIQTIGKHHRQIDVLINNAASDPRLTLEAMTAKAWDKLFALNLRAYFLTTQAAVPFMRRGGESIVNLSSITFHQGPANMSGYVATKAGIIGLTRSLARELGPRRIRVNVVSPGWVMTERQLRQYVTAKAKKTILRSQCVPELLQPYDLADVILFMASDASRALTGQELLADRGWYHS